MQKPPEVYTFEDLLEKQGYIVYSTVGYSMMPLLRQRRDIVEIRPKGPDRCSKYDVVLYKRGNKYILHRILKVRPKDYVIVGDNCIWREYGITDENILGVMTRIIRNGKTVTPDNRWYKLYVHLWCDFYPLRASILYIKRLAWSVLSRVKRRIMPSEKKDEGMGKQVTG